MASTPLEEKLKEAGKRYLEINEERRLSASRDDYTESFEATEDHVRIGVQAFLEHFGVEHSDSASTVECIAALREAVAGRPAELTEDAPLQFILRAVDDLEQVLRDIGYFRQGYGAGSGRAQPSDMRMTFAATVASIPFNAFKTLLVHTRGTKAQLKEERLGRDRLRELERGQGAARIDFVEVNDRIVTELGKDQDVRDFMLAIVKVCRARVRRRAWDRFTDLPYAADVERTGERMLEVMAAEPPPCPLHGFLFLIGNPTRDGETVADVYFSASDTYERSDDWAGTQMKYEPRRGFLGSDVLATIHELTDETGLGEIAEYPLELAYCAFVARASVLRYRREVAAGPVGASAGFQSGDLLHLGHVGSP
jgi:hypothetical protein